MLFWIQAFAWSSLTVKWLKMKVVRTWVGFKLCKMNLCMMVDREFWWKQKEVGLKIFFCNILYYKNTYKSMLLWMCVFIFFKSVACLCVWVWVHILFTVTVLELHEYDILWFRWMRSYSHANYQIKMLTWLRRLCN